MERENDVIRKRKCGGGDERKGRIETRTQGEEKGRELAGGWQMAGPSWSPDVERATSRGIVAPGAGNVLAYTVLVVLLDTR